MKPKKFLQEFREFINRGNVVDLAVAVIVGAAFTGIINSLINDLISPLLSLLSFGLDINMLEFTYGEGDDKQVFEYGKFLAAVLNFLTVSVVVFFIIKYTNKFSLSKTLSVKKECPYCKSAISASAVRCPNCTSILDEDKIPKDVR